MPIYEYTCEACGQQTEALQKISEPPLTDCPACGQPALKKLVSKAGFQLKGTGWYVTDFRDKNKPAAKGGDKPAGAGSSAEGGAKPDSAKADSTTESKSEAKTASTPAAKTESPKAD